MDPIDELALWIKAAAREGDRRVNAALQPLGVTAAQAEVLLVLDAAEPLTLGELGDLLVAEGGHPSRLVDRMVTAGWVERSTADDDRRRLRLRLTPRGRATAADAAAVKRGMLDELRPLAQGHDLAAMTELLAAYLRGSGWADTVRRRRALARPREASTAERDGQVSPAAGPATDAAR